MDTPSLTGAGRRHQEAARKDEARVFTFSDGVARVVVLEGRYWQALDIVSHRSGETIAEFVAATDLDEYLGFARDVDITLEEAIPIGLIGRIRGALEYWQSVNHAPANRNCAELAYRREIARQNAPNLHLAWMKSAHQSIS